MRFRASLLAFATLLPAVASAAPLPGLSADPQQTCPRTTARNADRPTNRRGQQLAPRKLTQLPNAQAYMAVYRQIGGCEAPLTMVDYRAGSRR